MDNKIGENLSVEPISETLESVEVDLRRAVFGGIISTIIILVGGWLSGEVSSTNAFRLFKVTLPHIRSFCGTLILALGNILALMLTLLSFSASLDVDMKWSHYKRIKQISWIVAATLIFTVLGYVLLNIPITESEALSARWFIIIYYVNLCISSLLGGAFITIVLLLYNTIRDMIAVFNPKRSTAYEPEPKGEEEE